MIRFNFIAVLSIASCLTLSACLQTRDSQEEETQQKVLQKQVYSQQTAIADNRQRFEQIDDDTRTLQGKIESTDNRISILGNKIDKNQQAQVAKDKELEARMKTLQEAVSKLDTDIAVINQQISVLAEQQKQNAAAAAAAAASGASEKASSKKEDSKSLYDSANTLYEKKKWKDAALEFERYRKASPKAKNIGEATYRIGVCFQEMGSSEDAQAFFEEVVARFPKSSEAKRASIRLKALKKK